MSENHALSTAFASLQDSTAVLSRSGLSTLQQDAVEDINAVVSWLQFSLTGQRSGDPNDASVPDSKGTRLLKSDASNSSSLPGSVESLRRYAASRSRSHEDSTNVSETSLADIKSSVSSFASTALQEPSNVEKTAEKSRLEETKSKDVAPTEAMWDEIQRFGKRFSNLPRAILIGSAGARIVFANQYFLDMLGYSEDDLVGKSFWKFVKQDSKNSTKHAVFNVRKQGSIDEFVNVYEAKDGKEVVFSWIGAHLGNGYELGIGRKLESEPTDSDSYNAMDKLDSACHASIKEERLRLSEALMEFEHLQVAVNEFIHDIRTPLHGMVNLFQEHNLFLQKHADKLRLPLKKSHLDDIAFCLNQLLRLAENKLAMVKSSSGYNVELHNHIKKSVMVLQQEFPKNKLVLNMEVKSKMKVFQMDAVWLYQIVANLVKNACTENPQTTVTLTVSHAHKNGEHEITLRVKDEGPGIPEDLVAYLTGRHDTKKSRGLGLGIVKKTASIMGGNISYEYKDGACIIVKIHPNWTDEEGSSHKSSIPKKNCKGGRTKNKSAELAEEETAKLLSSLRVLAVEDNKVNRKLLQHMLGGAVRNLRVESLASEMVEKFRKGEIKCRSDDLEGIDVILMDIGMPMGEMNGIEASAILRKIGFDGTIVGATGHNDEIIQKAITKGMDRILQKPYSKAELLKVIAASTQLRKD